jgi:hypothetical protein
MMTAPSAPGAAGITDRNVPAELVTLWERVRTLPGEIRQELEPIVAEALEEARYRGRVLSIAREALVRLRLDLELARFDLDATRREREDLRRLIGLGD